MLMIELRHKKQASPYKDWPDLYTNPVLSNYIISQNMIISVAITRL